MRGLQGDLEEAPVVRFGALSVWMVTVGDLGSTGKQGLGPKTELSEVVMAKVIEFYIPKAFKSPCKWAPQLQLGKIIEFRREVKKSA